MTQEIETEIVSDFQKQEIDSAVITLWEIQLKNDEYAHFFSGLEADLSTLQFRDREDSSIINSYSAVPLEFEGFDQVSDGPSARPTITFAISNLNFLNITAKASMAFTSEFIIFSSILQCPCVVKSTTL